MVALSLSFDELADPHFGQLLEECSQLRCSPLETLAKESPCESIFRLLDLLDFAFLANHFMHVKQEPSRLWG